MLTFDLKPLSWPTLASGALVPIQYTYKYIPTSSVTIY